MDQPALDHPMFNIVTLEAFFEKVETDSVNSVQVVIDEVSN